MARQAFVCSRDPLIAIGASALAHRTFHVFLPGETPPS